MNRPHYRRTSSLKAGFLPSMCLLLPPLRPYYLSARCRCRPEAGFCFNIFKIRAVVTKKVIRRDRNLSELCSLEAVRRLVLIGWSCSSSSCCRKYLTTYIFRRYAYCHFRTLSACMTQQNMSYTLLTSAAGHDMGSPFERLFGRWRHEAQISRPRLTTRVCYLSLYGRFL